MSTEVGVWLSNGNIFSARVRLCTGQIDNSRITRKQKETDKRCQQTADRKPRSVFRMKTISLLGALHRPIEGPNNNYIPACKNSGRNSGKRRYPKSIKNKLKAKHRAWLKAKLSNDPQAKAHYKDVAKECAILISNYDKDREQTIIDSHDLGKFYRYINGKLSCKTGVGPIYKNDGSYAVSDKDKAVTLNKFFSSVCTIDNKVMPEYSDKIPSGECLNNVLITPPRFYRLLRN
jgi:hypothetical protein